MCAEHAVCRCLQGLLREYAPVCLKAYFDKDSRKAFCQPQLWTEPYNNLMAKLSSQHLQDGGVLATTAAVVQALLVSTGLTGQEEDSSSQGGAAGQQAASIRSSSPSGPVQQSPAAAAAASAARGAHVPGLRTNALLSLLKAAPQCVPFAVRLELFRQMMEQDKVCVLGAAPDGAHTCLLCRCQLAFEQLRMPCVLGNVLVHLSKKVGLQTSTWNTMPCDHAIAHWTSSY